MGRVAVWQGLIAALGRVTLLSAGTHLQGAREFLEHWTELDG